MTKEQTLEDLTPLIKHIAKDFFGTDKEDLMQAGAIGVLKALQNYQDKGITKFSSYAYKYIYGEMFDFVMKDKKIKLNKDILRLRKQIEVARNNLSLKTGKIPTYEEVARFLECPISQIMETLMVTDSMMSLDSQVENQRDFYETIPCPKTLSLEEKMTLFESIELLPEPEQSIIRYRYFKDYTQQETAEKLGLSQVKVSRYETKSLGLLRKYCE